MTRPDQPQEGTATLEPPETQDEAARGVRGHPAFPQTIMLVFAALFATLWWVTIATGATPDRWTSAWPYAIIASVFLAGAMTIWGVRHVLE